MYRLFVIVGGVVVMALFGALIAPPFVDWTNYRTRLEEQASAAIGQTVRVGGRVSVRLLPLPKVTFADLTVGEDEDGKPMMTAKSFTLLAELMPLLSGEVRIVDMELVEPDIVVNVGQGGAVSWTERAEGSVAPQRITVENLAIRGGRMRIAGLAGGRELRAVGIDATVSAQSLLGPWRILADGEFEGRKGTVEIATGKAQDNGSIRMRIAARPDDVPYRFAGDGALALADGLLQWVGAFDIAPALRRGTDKAGEKSALPVRVAGKFAASPNGIDLPEFKMDIGGGGDPYTITGKGKVSIREEVSFRLQADGRQIDLDRLGQPNRNPGSGQGGDSAQAGEASLGERLATLRGVLDRIPVPVARGRVDFLLPAIVAGDTMIRDIAVVAEPDGGRWKVPSLKATFPGNTAVEAEGVFGVGENFGFSGHMLLSSRQPTGFAQWLTGNSNAALRALGAAGFAADVAFNDSQATLENLELALGDATLKGKLQRLTPPGGRPAILAQLAGETIDLDDLIAIYSLTQSRDGPALASHDFDLELQAAKFSGLGMSARGVDAAIRIEGGAVTVNRLKASDFLGASIDSSGRLTDLLATPNGDFRLNIKAGDGSALAGLAMRHLGDNAWLRRLAADPALSRDLDLTLEASAQAGSAGSSGNAALNGVAGGTTLTARDRFEGLNSDWRRARHDLALKLEQGDPAMLARQFALAALPISPPGPLGVSAEFAGTLAAGLGVEVLASAPGSDLSLSGSLREENGAGGALVADLAATLGLRDADPWLTLFGRPLPDTGAGNPAAVSLRLARDAKGVFRATAIAGNYGGNAFSGELAASLSASGMAFDGALAFDRLSAAWLGELALGPGTLTPDGSASPDFASPMLAGASGEIALKAAEFDLGGGPVGSGFSGKLAIGENGLALREAAGLWFGGKLGGNVRLANMAGKASLSGQFALTGAEAAAIAEFAGHTGLMSGAADISGNFDGAAGNAAKLVSAISGSGAITVRDADLPGLSTDALSAVLHAGDNEKFEITTPNVEAFARQLFLKGKARFGAIADAFTLGGGKVALRNIAGENPRAKLSGQAEYDLPSGAASARLTLALKTDGGAAQGSEPAISLAFASPGKTGPILDVSALEGFLSARAFDREQRRLDLLQEMVAERQRFAAELRMLKAREALREATGVARKASTVDEEVKTGGTQASGQPVDLMKEIEKRVLKR